MVNMNFTNFTKNLLAVATQRDVWEKQQYKVKLRVFRIMKSWTLKCKEKGISWTDSAAKHLQEKAN
ncbi:MAG: hypothetical protein L6N96_03715 [Candidatus Methylarchaceae archaeon HK02M2]|nr:hypothetical protein [Candidatus Methylarchaceae archaeon HK01M]MCP8323266.1 hypothetical protein [Candidatus Methylarchaceae archaeon HK02M2]